MMVDADIQQLERTLAGGREAVRATSAAGD
jgi:hypothetical protein